MRGVPDGQSPRSPVLVGDGDAVRGVPTITEAMTVNSIVKIHPEVRAIFQRFKIDCGTDGISCLDELCWWRGIEVEGLL